MAAFSRLLSLLRQMQPDVVQTLCLRADVLGRIAARICSGLKVPRSPPIARTITPEKAAGPPPSNPMM